MPIVRRVSAPLDGYRIIDLTTVIAGPYATQVLGDLGADVIKVEHPDAPDPMRHAGRGARHADMGPIYLTLNRNKRSVSLDLSKDAAKLAMRALVASADALITNVRTQGLARLGFDYAGARACREDIVYVHLVGFGHDGPYAGRQAYDDLVQAASGLADLLPKSDASLPPHFVPGLVADKVTGLHAVYALLAALLQRERTGEGQFVEVPMLEATVTFNLAEHLYGHAHVPPTDQWGYRRALSPHRRPFPTKDHYIAIMPYSETQWRRFFELAGHPELWTRFEGASMQERTENVDALYERIGQVTGKHTTDEWIALLSPHQIPCMRVNRLEDLPDDPHLQATGVFEQRTHPEEGAYINLRPPVQFERADTSLRRHAPRLGADGREVLSELGLDADLIDQLEASSATQPK